MAGMSVAVHHAMRTALAFAFVVATGCIAHDDPPRGPIVGPTPDAGSGSGVSTCPDGETCSPLTPNGLTQTDFDRLHVPAGTVGHHTVAVAAGGAAHSVDVEFVDHADTLQALEAAGTLACFGAYAHGAFIAGLTWTFTVNGAAVPGDATVFGPNCVWNPSTTGGPFTVTATAGGKSLTVTTTPAQAAYARPDRTPELGERAASRP
jgi:hypothetical protein